MKAARDFGWYPEPLTFSVGDISIEPFPDLDQIVEAVRGRSEVHASWIYAPRIVGSGGRISPLPYPSRIFGLPNSHRIGHAKPDGGEHLDFLVWALGFFVGMRLTTTDAGFLDATPLRPGSLCDFSRLTSAECSRAMSLAEEFWQRNKTDLVRPRRWAAAVHLLFLAQYPQALQFERFGYLYSAIDTCFRLAADFYPIPNGNFRHKDRIAWLCGNFGMVVPTWGDADSRAQTVSSIRNPAIHEGLYLNAPLGFALHGVGTGENLTLEMEALVCRFLVALIGDPRADYVRSPVTTRMTHGWSP